ncbi:MAG: hypothetical protein IJ642_00045 [Oscillospiraceae bacterium]|nr:hypothetical protein [Oscillospiraceae bacterium]
MFEPQQRIHEINQMEHGTARLETISQAIKEADDENQHYWRLYFRYQYMTESTMHGDNFKGLLCFPEYLKIFDEHPELEDDMYQDMMWAFKWVIGNLDDYYQISLDEVNHYFEEFKKRSQKYGFSLRTYYMKQVDFWLHTRPDSADVAYANFNHYPRSLNSDCEACELNFKMKVLLSKNDEKQALEVIRPVLEHQKSCAEIPHVTYARLAKYYFMQKNFEEARYYADLCEKLISGKQEFLRETGWLLEIYSRMDSNRGWKLFKYSLAFFMECLNPAMRMEFARGAWRMMQSISAEMESVRSPLLGVLPVAPSGDGWNVQELADFFYETAHDISQKLDQRNQNAYYQELLNQELPEYDEEQAFQETAKSVHGLVRKAQTAIVIFLHTKLTQDELEQRIKNSEVISCSRDEHACYASVPGKEMPLDIMINADIPVPPLDPDVVHGMEQEEIQKLLASPCCCVFASELSGTPQTAYHVIMNYLSGLFPEMNGIINLTALKAYPASWVRFAGAYLPAVSQHDLYSVYLSGSHETGEVWGSTIGLCACGMRELEFVQANTENFSGFAAFLDKTAAMCIENNSLPDENRTIALCYDQKEQEYGIQWQNPETVLKKLSPDSIAVSIKREIPSGILNLHELPDLSELEFQNSRQNFRRRIQLAKETFPVFQKALTRGFTSALVRLEIEVSEEDYNYEIELLWAEVKPDGKTAVLVQTSEAVPDHPEGEEIEITQENTADWRIRFSETEDMLSPEEAYLLEELP